MPATRAPRPQRLRSSTTQAPANHCADTAHTVETFDEQPRGHSVSAIKGFDTLDHAHPGRFLLSLGASHAPRVDPDEQRSERPWSRMVGNLDELEAQRPGVPSKRRVLAGLGPRLSTKRRRRVHTSLPLSTRRSHARTGAGAGRFALA